MRRSAPTVLALLVAGALPAAGDVPVPAQEAQEGARGEREPASPTQEPGDAEGAGDEVPGTEPPPPESDPAPGNAAVTGPGDDAPALSAAKASERYHAIEEADGFFSAWLGTGLAERLELGVSAGGRPLLGVQFGGPGAAPLDERATVLLLGGLDGASPSGTEAVLSITGALLATPERLPAQVTFVSVPWANPDGLARWLEGGACDGRNGRALDDDRDGRVDEDPPDDMDEDGLVLSLLVEDPAGAWARCSDGRFLRPAHEGDAPRYHLVPEGRDDDGDGRFNEDDVGGVALDQNFPLGWRGPWEGAPSGRAPLSEREARSLAEFARARRTVAALLFQGNHGGLALPGGRSPEKALVRLPVEADEPVFRRLGASFVRATGRRDSGVLPLREARGEERPGAAIDWLYGALGALAVEVGVWGPGVEREPRAPVLREGRYGPDGELAAGDVPESDRAWSRWLDDTRGGMGFVDWQPVDLGDGRRGMVGGWEPFTCFNPPPDVLGRAVAGLDAFVLDLSSGMPRVEIDVREVRREGRLCVLSARVLNGGWLPTGLATSSEPTVLELEVPEGVELIAGERRLELGHLPGASASAEQSWLLVAPEGTVFRFRALSPWAAPAVREVRL